MHPLGNNFYSLTVTMSQSTCTKITKMIKINEAFEQKSKDIHIPVWQK